MVKVIDEGGQLKVKAINLIVVLDSYDAETIQRIDYYTSVIQTISKLLS